MKSISLNNTLRRWYTCHDFANVNILLKCLNIGNIQQETNNKQLPSNTHTHTHKRIAKDRQAGIL